MYSKAYNDIQTCGSKYSELKHLHELNNHYSFLTKGSNIYRYKNMWINIYMGNKYFYLLISHLDNSGVIEKTRHLDYYSVKERVIELKTLIHIIYDTKYKEVG
jgi:hypothetical protein